MDIYKKFLNAILEYKIKRTFRPQSEILIFFRRNSFYLLLAFFCIMLWIKQTSIPFLWNYNWLTSLLFLSPPVDSFGYGLLSFFSTLGIAYLASLIFYFIIDYLPTRKKEIAAMQLVTDNLEDIDSHLAMLFSYLMFFANIGTNSANLVAEDFPKLCNLHLNNDTIFCHTQHTRFDNDLVEMETLVNPIEKLSAIVNICKRIVAQADYIIKLPYAINMEDTLIAWLGMLKRNILIDNYASLSPAYIAGLDGNCFVCKYSPEDVFELYWVFTHLRMFPFIKHNFIVTPALTEDIEKAQLDWEEMQNRFPDRIELMNHLSSLLNHDE